LVADTAGVITVGPVVAAVQVAAQVVITNLKVLEQADKGLTVEKHFQMMAEAAVELAQQELMLLLI
jgi:hypothetical protein